MKKLLAMTAAAMLLLTFTPVYAEDAAPSGDEMPAEVAAAIEQILQEQATEEETQEIETQEEKYPDVSGTEYEEAAELLDSHKIMTGYPDGTFRPNENISRSEFVVVLSRLMSMSHVSKTMRAEQIFSDVSKDHWAAREIQIISDKKIISGCGDDTFRPEEYVTYAQAVKMLIEMLGYGDEAEGKGGWPLGYLIMANELGIADGTEYSQNDILTRGMASKLLQNVLGIKRADGRKVEDTLGEMYFYVSPNGNDSNPGTEEKPWKTAEKAGKTAMAGTTVIFEDGEYFEKNITTVVNSGEKGAPITFKARNKHKATLKYAEALMVKQKFTMKNVSYINVRDLAFTQEKRAADNVTSATMDILLNASSADHLEFTGNKFWNVYEEGIKLTYVDRFLLEGNEVIESNHEGFDVFCSSNGIVRNNRWLNCGRVSYMNKGNSYNNLVYNNYAYYNIVITANASSHAMGIGGSSNNLSPRDIGKDTGWEAYNCVYFNNVIISEVKGGLPIGLYFTGCRDCHAYNNIVVGAVQAVQTRATLGLQKGWEWDPPVVNPTIKNNIFINCEQGIYFWEEPENPIISNNIYYNVKDKIDKNGIVKNPRMVDYLTDWNLLADSPAINAGAEIPDSIPGFDRPFNGEAVVEAIEIPKVDYNGEPRTGTWDIGIYNVD